MPPVFFRFLAATALLTAALSVHADEVELLSGIRVRGRVAQRTSTDVTVQVTFGGRTITRKYPLSKIHAITTSGGREVINEKTRRSSSPPPRSTRTPAPRTPTVSRRATGRSSTLSPSSGATRSTRAIEALINQHNRATTLRIMDTLGGMYFRLLEDYARAAFWFRKAGVERNRALYRSGVRLAECYLKLGSKPMAMQLLSRLRPNTLMIKLFADMGEIQRALQLAQAVERVSPDIAHMYAGDACRVVGRFQEAIRHYEDVLAVRATGKYSKRIEGNHKRARASLDAIRLFETLDVTLVPDGTYEADSLGYAGQIFVAVDMRSGRIEAVRVTKHQERQFYSALIDTTRKIIEKQTVKGVDATSSATLTSEAIINATAKALAGAMR